MAYRLQIFTKNYKTQSRTDGTLTRTLTHATDISVRSDLNSPEQIMFEVPRGSDDASALEIGRVVRVLDGTTVVASGVIVGPLDKTRPMIPVTVAGKAEILNWAITPYEFELEGDTAEAQIRELLKNYRFFRQNTPDAFNAGTLTSTEVLTVAGDPDEYFLTLRNTNDVFAESGTYISQPILLTDDTLGDPDDITRLRYIAELGNDTAITVAFRHANSGKNSKPSSWSAWSSEYDLTSEKNTETLGLTGYSISNNFRWIQLRFSLSTSDTSISPALQAFEIICEYPCEITAGNINLPGPKLNKSFSFASHHQAIREIVSARNAELRIDDDYTLDIAERFGSATAKETFKVGENCNVVSFQQQDRRLSTEIWSLGEGKGIAQELISADASDTAIEKYGARPWVHKAQAISDSQRTQEITDELARRSQPRLQVVLDELAKTRLSADIGDAINFQYSRRNINTTLRVIGIRDPDPRKGTPRQFILESNEGFFYPEPDKTEGKVRSKFNKFPILYLTAGEIYYFTEVLEYLTEPSGYSISAKRSADDLSQTVLKPVEIPSGSDTIQISVVPDVMKTTPAKIIVRATHRNGGLPLVQELEIVISPEPKESGLTTVTTDDTITGDGTPETPIGVQFPFTSSHSTTISTNTSVNSQQSTDIQTNKTNITKNATAISTNASVNTVQNTAIATNSKGISTNVGNISKNATAISTNASVNTVQSTAISKNASTNVVQSTAIKTNATAISTNVGNISKNASTNIVQSTAISKNVVEIAKRLKSVATDSTITGDGTAGKPLKAVQQDLTHDHDQIATNKKNITTNSKGISTNVGNISKNASTNVVQSTAIKTNATAIKTNATAISTNAVNISKNASTNVVQSTAISKNVVEIAKRLITVATDETITGDGTAGKPLHAVQPDPPETGDPGITPAQSTAISKNTSTNVSQSTAISKNTSTNVSQSTAISKNTSTNVSQSTAISKNTSTNVSQSTAISKNVVNISKNTSTNSVQSTAISKNTSSITTASTNASTASKNASTALTRATTASTNAGTASTNASTALEKKADKTTVTAVSTNASTALTRASTALSTANTKATITSVSAIGSTLITVSRNASNALVNAATKRIVRQRMSVILKPTSRSGAIYFTQNTSADTITLNINASALKTLLGIKGESS